MKIALTGILIVSVLVLCGCGLFGRSKLSSIEVSSECSIKLKNMSADNMATFAQSRDIDFPCEMKTVNSGSDIEQLDARQDRLRQDMEQVDSLQRRQDRLRRDIEEVEGKVDSEEG